MWARELDLSCRVLTRASLPHSFLDQINRIAERGYVPTIDDVLHARIQTIGVAEHTFVVQHNSRPVQWRLYDVGGARGQRHTWAPFFDDANAIIYVAPISAFDQVG
jgi:hypothetical protein